MSVVVHDGRKWIKIFRYVYVDWLKLKNKLENLLNIHGFELENGLISMYIWIGFNPLEINESTYRNA